MGSYSVVSSWFNIDWFAKPPSTLWCPQGIFWLGLCVWSLCHKQVTQPSPPHSTTWVPTSWTPMPWPWRQLGRSFKTTTATKCFLRWASEPSYRLTDESPTSLLWWESKTRRGSRGWRKAGRIGDVNHIAYTYKHGGSGCSPKVKPKCPNCPLVAGCCIGKKPCLLSFSRWDTDKTKNSRSTLYIFSQR